MLCAPFAQAMNSLLPKARPLAQILMNPSVRSALITQGQTSAHAAAPQTQRGLMMIAQSTARPANQWLLNGPNLTRQLSTTTRQQAATSMKSLALKAGVVGLAYAASPATVACSDGNYLSLFTNLWATAVGIITVGSIIWDIVDPNGWYSLAEEMKRNPELAKQYAPYALQNFEALVKSFYGLKILREVMSSNPELAKEFTPYAVAHIESLVKNFDGRDFLSDVMEHNPEAAKQFAPHAEAHFESLTKDRYGIYFLQDVMEHNPEAAKEFTPHAVAHIESLMKEWYGIYFLKGVMKGNPDAVKEFTPYVVAHIESLMKDFWGNVLLQDIMNRNPKAAKEFTPHVVAHIGSLAKDHYGANFLSDVMNRNPKAAKEFTPYAAAHIKSLVSSEAGMQCLHDIMHNNPQASEKFAPYALQNFESLVNNEVGRTMLVSIANYNATAKTALLAELKKYMGHKSDVSSSFTWNGMFYRLLNSERLTPTEFGLLYAEKEISEHKKQTLEDPNIKKVVDTVIDLEKKYEPTHYTFTHGRNRAYECVSTVYGGLWKYAYNTPVPEDFIFTHTKDVHDPLMHKVKLHEERKLHEANIKERANIAGEIRNRRLFLNTQLFGNMGMRGSSSFSYFLYSSNASGTEVKVKIKDVFGQFGQQALYEKYKDEFEALEKEHAALSEQGEILVVAVPKDRVNQDVTCMHVNGNAAPQYMINGKMTNNVQEILRST